MSKDSPYEKMRQQCLRYIDASPDSEYTLSEVTEIIRRAFPSEFADLQLAPTFAAYIDASQDLIRTATAFVEELRRMGYGETSERALPGAFDPFVEALKRLK